MEALGKLTESLGSELMKLMFEQVSTLRTPWIITPQQQQQELLDRWAAAIDETIQKGIAKILGGGCETVVITLESVTAKEAVTKVTARATQLSSSRDLTEWVGSKLVLVLDDPSKHTAGVDQFKATADQRSLEL